MEIIIIQEYKNDYKYINLNKTKWFYIHVLTTNKARIFQNIFFLLLFCSQICKCVNDDTKNEVENNDDDNEKEEHVVNDPGNVEGFIHGWGSQHITNSSSVSQTLIHGSDKAKQQCVTGTFFVCILWRTWSRRLFCGICNTKFLKIQLWIN